MSKNKNICFEVTTSSPPIVEVDSEVGAYYIRFSKAKVARTHEVPNDELHIAIDFGVKNQVVGIEVIGPIKIEIEKIMKKARVSAPKVDFASAQIALAS